MGLSIESIRSARQKRSVIQEKKLAHEECCNTFVSECLLPKVLDEKELGLAELIKLTRRHKDDHSKQNKYFDKNCNILDDAFDQLISFYITLRKQLSPEETDHLCCFINRFSQLAEITQNAGIIDL